MSLTVCLSADTIGYPEGGGHLWAYLNWALGLRSIGCEVVWLESVSTSMGAGRLSVMVDALKDRLARYGLAERVALCSRGDEPLPEGIHDSCLDLAAAAEADLLLNLRYATHSDVVKRFRRTALLDIDPGLLQIWLASGAIQVAPHNVYFTTGETVGRADSGIPNAGISWNYTPPCVALDWWPVTPAPPGAPFSTVSHWYGSEWIEDADGVYCNDKRSGFLPFLNLPSHASQPLELALCLSASESDERSALLARGWRVVDSGSVASTPWDYQSYIGASRGEFSCAKPSCVRLQNAWISDRTVCYLASGKPAVLQNTGPSSILPNGDGVFRFETIDEASAQLNQVAADFERQSRLARDLAAHHFDAKLVTRRLLERALA